ncbi:MAG: OsmC family protein [Burkholderiales bacterium]|nr:OsmC family protein [Burkholderiales bacterium]
MDARPKVFAATVAWRRRDEPFVGGRYSRAHTWEFDGGAVVPASSSPLSVPLPFSDAEAVDPEEAFVAAISSCHMLFFLAFAAKRHWVIDSYTDQATGTMERNAQGHWAMTRVALRPLIEFAGEAPAQIDIDDLHREAHEECYIANSVKCEIVVEAPE